MKHDLRSTVHRFIHVLEAVIGLLLTIAVILSVIGMVLHCDPAALLTTPDLIGEYVHAVATIVLAIEFVNMLCTHTLDSVVEVVLMVVARQMIVAHGTPVDNLICCISIALLFVVRKFLFVTSLDKLHHSHQSLLRDVAELFRKAPAKADYEEEEETRDHAHRQEAPMGTK